MERATEVELVERAVAGDQAAIADLWREHTPRMVALAYFKTGNQTVAEDLASLAWVRILRKLPEHQPDPRGLGPWAYTVVKNLVIDRFKSGPARYEYGVERMETGPDPLDTPDDLEPVDVAMAKETRRELEGLIRQLTPEQAQVIELRFFAGLNVAETAAVMEREEGAVKALQYRATRQLGKLAGEHMRGGR